MGFHAAKLILEEYPEQHLEGLAVLHDKSMHARIHPGGWDVSPRGKWPTIGVLIGTEVEGDIHTFDVELSYNYVDKDFCEVCIYGGHPGAKKSLYEAGVFESCRMEKWEG